MEKAAIENLNPNFLIINVFNILAIKDSQEGLPQIASKHSCEFEY